MEWAAAHAVAFGLREQCVGTLLAWGPVWSRLHAAEELHDATRRMVAAKDVPRFASDHRAVVLGHVQAHRERAARQAANRAENVAANTTCQVCGGAGLVVVPHPGLDAAGRWVGYLAAPTPDANSRTDRRLLGLTAAVSCVCDRGRRSAEADRDRGKPSLDIVAYEQQYPQWQRVAAERAAVLHASDGSREPSASELQRQRETVEAVKARVGRGVRS